MKLLLVLGSDDNYDFISGSIRSLGFELIRYRHVLKAIDNIDEIDPTAIIVSARDFPRHWKILVQFVRSERSKDACPIIILKGDNFDAEETSKAGFLGANGVLNEALDNQEDIDQLRTMLALPAEDVPPRQFTVEPHHRIGMLIAGFQGASIIGADVKTISSNGLSFTPAPSLPPEGLIIGTEFSECSLRAGDAILSPVCRITDTGTTITLEFTSFPGDEQHVFEQYLEELYTFS